MAVNLKAHGASERISAQGSYRVRQNSGRIRGSSVRENRYEEEPSSKGVISGWSHAGLSADKEGGEASRADANGSALQTPATGREELGTEVQGRYEKMRVLGRGSFGAVTLIKDLRDSRLYAMKTLAWSSDKDDVKSPALEEVRLMRMLHHPCIVALSDVFISQDSRLLCLTMTYCESGDLGKVIAHAKKRGTCLPEKQVLGWFCQICLGIDYLHKTHNILHRDIKPCNLFLIESQKQVKIGDFGLAKALNEPGQTVKTEVGTPYYTSPEMCNNQPYGFSSDVWSLGIVLYEMLALSAPFHSRDLVDLVGLVTSAAPPPLPPQYSSDTCHLIDWLLQKDPRRRPTLAQALGLPLLRKHATAWIKAYRPLSVPERQRRAETKELGDQMDVLERLTGEISFPEDLASGVGSGRAGATASDQNEDTNIAATLTPTLPCRRCGSAGSGGACDCQGSSSCNGGSGMNCGATSAQRGKIMTPLSDKRNAQSSTLTPQGDKKTVMSWAREGVGGGTRWDSNDEMEGSDYGQEDGARDLDAEIWAQEDAVNGEGDAQKDLQETEEIDSVVRKASESEVAEFKKAIQPLESSDASTLLNTPPSDVIIVESNGVPAVISLVEVDEPPVEVSGEITEQQPEEKHQRNSNDSMLMAGHSRSPSVQLVFAVAEAKSSSSDALIDAVQPNSSSLVATSQEKERNVITPLHLPDEFQLLCRLGSAELSHRSESHRGMLATLSPLSSPGAKVEETVAPLLLQQPQNSSPRSSPSLSVNSARSENSTLPQLIPAVSPAKSMLDSGTATASPISPSAPISPKIIGGGAAVRRASAARHFSVTRATEVLVTSETEGALSSESLKVSQRLSDALSFGHEHKWDTESAV